MSIGEPIEAHGFLGVAALAQGLRDSFKSHPAHPLARDRHQIFQVPAEAAQGLAEKVSPIKIWLFAQGYGARAHPIALGGGAARLHIPSARLCINHSTINITKCRRCSTFPIEEGRHTTIDPRVVPFLCNIVQAHPCVSHLGLAHHILHKVGLVLTVELCENRAGATARAIFPSFLPSQSHKRLRDVYEELQVLKRLPSILSPSRCGRKEEPHGEG
mmetsp:Transcript_94692/g.237531  ORF Transcript_94692/g.237531 Transcript_94692/m.237531 type:complete len:216 (-) Transcript_94692:112-759(-)